jgi:hypothetical protein
MEELQTPNLWDARNPKANLCDTRTPKAIPPGCKNSKGQTSGMQEQKQNKLRGP